MCLYGIIYRIKTGHFDNDRDIGPISFVMARERAALEGHNEGNRANIRVSLSKWPVFILYIARLHLPK
jgi:hypothetical protein